MVDIIQHMGAQDRKSSPEGLPPALARSCTIALVGIYRKKGRDENEPQSAAGTSSTRECGLNEADRTAKREEKAEAGDSLLCETEHSQ